MCIILQFALPGLTCAETSLGFGKRAKLWSYKYLAAGLSQGVVTSVFGGASAFLRGTKEAADREMTFTLFQQCSRQFPISRAGGQNGALYGLA
jgi:hypothetical protein